MTTLLFTRPVQWAQTQTGGLRLVHAPVFGAKPSLRDGQEMADNVGGVVTRVSLALLVKMFEELRPDAFLFWPMYGQDDQDEHRLDSVRKALIRCKQISPRTVFFYGNGNQASAIRDNKPDFNVGAFANVIDVVLDNNHDKRIHAIYRGRGYRTDTLYTFGFDPGDIEDMSGRPAEHDVFFGGSYTGRSRFPNSAFRHELVVRMANKFDMLVRGRGKWPAGCHKKGYVHGWNYPREIGKCAVALGCNHIDLCRYYTKRMIYSLATGRPHVVRYIPGMENDFENMLHLWWYKTVDEAVEIVRDLVGNPTLCESIGEWGRHIAVENHSWKARLQDMRGILERHL